MFSNVINLQERNERTVFVGNVELDLKPKDIIKFFKKVGKVVLIVNIFVRFTISIIGRECEVPIGSCPR